MLNYPDLFSLDFTRTTPLIFSMLPGAISLSIAFYTIFAFHKSRKNVSFSAFVLLIGLWQMTEGLMRMSVEPAQASEWYRISGYFFIAAMPLGLLFVLYYTEWYEKLSQNFLIAFLFLPAITLFLVSITHLDNYTIVESEFSYWIANPVPGFFVSLMFAWNAACGIMLSSTLWLHHFQEKKKKKAGKYTLLLAIGFTFPVAGGIIGEVIMPVLGYNNLPLTAPLMTILFIIAFISITKHKMLDFSPKHQWNQIIESMNEGLLIVDAEDKIMYANESLCRMIEYDFEELKGKVAYELFFECENMRNRMREVNEERLQNKSGQYEMKLRSKTGRQVWMLISGAPYLDRHGKPVGSIGVMTDITQLKSSEQELISSELKLKRAQAVAHVGSWELDFESGKANWSDEACRIYGIDVADNFQHTYESWLSFIYPDDLADVLKTVEKNKMTFQDTSLRHRILLRDGTVKHILSVSQYQFNEKNVPTGIFGVCHDITKQVQGEQAINESQKNIKAFVDESLLSIYFMDPETGQINFANTAFCELLGYSQEEISQIHVEDFITDCASGHFLKGEKKLRDIERIWKRKDGTLITILENRCYLDRNGKEMIYVAALDITERKKIEMALELTNQELEIFIYKSSHDLRGPLASIIGLTNISKLEVKDPAGLKYLGMIESATQKLDYTLTELVKAMNIKKIEDYNERIDFNDVLSSVLQRFEFQSAFSRLKIIQSVDVRSPFLSNRYIIETIFQNLIENAIKYQDFNSSNSHLAISVIENEHDIEIKIADNGIGINRSIQSRIYDMYFRGTATSSGSGLGLYLVKKSVDKLQGRIELQSDVGEGTIFTITIKKAQKISLEKGPKAEKLRISA
jgi:PAS domain S-box-containing protein